LLEIANQIYVVLGSVMSARPNVSQLLL